MTNRERFKAIAKSQRPGDLWISDFFWRETFTAWIEQGAPPQITNATYRGQYFGFDYSREAREILSGLVLVPFAPGGIETMLFIPPIVPQFECKILGEEGDKLIVVNQGGQTVKVLKNHMLNMPMYLDHPVKDRETWKRYKKRLDPDIPDRWPPAWESYKEKLNSKDYPVILNVGSLFGFLREWMGLESLLYTFYDDPNLIEDMMDTMVHLELEVIKKAVQDLRIDQASFWEDMCYKSGPLISPDMFRRFMMPRYRKITDLLHENGIDIIFVDSDGNISELIPLWLECGINYVWPLEVAAGNDAVALRKEYGRELILGGNIDKRALIKGKPAIKEEIMSKAPFLLEKGGYFPSVDHMVPPDVTLENYQYYVNTMREVAGMEKLTF